MNPALVQKIMVLEAEGREKDLMIERLTRQLSVKTARLREIHGESLAMYARRKKRRQRRKEIATDWLVAGAVVLVLWGVVMLTQEWFMVRWGLVP